MSSDEYDSETSVSSDEITDQGSNKDFQGKTLKDYSIISELGSGSYSRFGWL